LRDYQAVVALCFANVEKDGRVDVKEIANRRRLSVQTIYNLRNGGVSLFTRIGTLDALCRACGFEFGVRKTGVFIYLAE
jgi:DNA-binding Xre family transcriptional regulator